jgi:hypothetical protein
LFIFSKKHSLNRSVNYNDDKEETHFEVKLSFPAFQPAGGRVVDDVRAERVSRVFVHFAVGNPLVDQFGALHVDGEVKLANEESSATLVSKVIIGYNRFNRFEILQVILLD